MKTFGAFVQGLREHANLDRKEFAKLVQFSLSTVTSIENGRRMAQPEFVERAEGLTGNTGALRRAAPHVARTPGLARWFREWARLETTAITLDTYECRVIPGLLQTEAYARAMSLSVPPLPSEEELSRRTAARLARQELLEMDRQPPCGFSFIIDQAVLERHTGGEDVTRELFDHLLAVTEKHWNIELQIVPLRHPFHAGLDGPFRLLETPDNQRFAYAEGQETGQLITTCQEVSLLNQRYAKLRTQALTPEDSKGLLRQLRGAL